MKKTVLIYSFLTICMAVVGVLLPHVSIAATSLDPSLLPIGMAFGTVGVAASQTVYGTGAYPQRSGSMIGPIWANSFTVKFYTATVLAAICNTNHEGLIKNKGDKVVIHQLPDINIFDYDKGDEIVYEDLDKPNIELDINYAKGFAFKADDIDKIQANMKGFMDEYGTVASEQMKVKIDSHVLNLLPTQVAATNAGLTAGAKSGDINLGTQAAPISVTKANILDVLVDLGTVLDEADIPETGRNLVLPARICGLIKKSDLKNATITGDNVSVMRNGRLGEIDRFTIFSSNNLAKSGSVYTAIGSTKHATTFAAQMVKVEYLDKLEKTFASAIRGLNVYGFKVEKPEAMAVAKMVLG